MKVVMLSTKDYAGSGRKITEAVGRYGVDVSIYTLERHQYGYPVDGTIADGDAEKIKRQVKAADVIHFKGDEPPKDDWFGVPIPAHVPKIITVGGSSFRRNKEGKRNAVCNGHYPLSDYFTAKVRTAITPDLNYPEFEGIYTQHCIDSTAAPYTWKKRRVPIIMHCPSMRRKKGTEMILTAVRLLKEQGYAFDFRLIENVSNKECIEAKKKASIYIDQLSFTGFYGMSAVESMQFGVPTIAYISQQAREQAMGKVDNCPVISPFMSAYGLFEHLKFYLDNLSYLEDVSYLTKVWANEFHSYETVGRLWLDIYNSLN